MYTILPAVHNLTNQHAVDNFTTLPGVGNFTNSPAVDLDGLAAGVRSWDGWDHDGATVEHAIHYLIPALLPGWRLPGVNKKIQF